MKNTFRLLCLLLTAMPAIAGPPEPELIQKLTTAITNLCPNATIEVDRFKFAAKYDTMVYTIHTQSKTGEFFPGTVQHEGPAFRGFVLDVSLIEGEYGGAADAPQTLQGPYFATFFNAPPADSGKQHYQVYFSYGAKLDPKLKAAILEAIPKTRFQQAGPAYPPQGVGSADP